MPRDGPAEAPVTSWGVVAEVGAVGGGTGLENSPGEVSRMLPLTLRTEWKPQAPEVKAAKFLRPFLPLPPTSLSPSILLSFA